MIGDSRGDGVQQGDVTPLAELLHGGVLVPWASRAWAVYSADGLLISQAVPSVRELRTRGDYP